MTQGHPGSNRENHCTDRTHRQRMECSRSASGPTPRVRATKADRQPRVRNMGSEPAARRWWPTCQADSGARGYRRVWTAPRQPSRCRHTVRNTREHCRGIIGFPARLATAANAATGPQPITGKQGNDAAGGDRNQDQYPVGSGTALLALHLARRLAGPGGRRRRAQQTRRALLRSRNSGCRPQRSPA